MTILYITTNKNKDSKLSKLSDIESENSSKVIYLSQYKCRVGDTQLAQLAQTEDGEVWFVWSDQTASNAKDI